MEEKIHVLFGAIDPREIYYLMRDKKSRLVLYKATSKKENLIMKIFNIQTVISVCRIPGSMEDALYEKLNKLGDGQLDILNRKSRYVISLNTDIHIGYRIRVNKNRGILYLKLGKPKTILDRICLRKRCYFDEDMKLELV